MLFKWSRQLRWTRVSTNSIDLEQVWKWVIAFFIRKQDGSQRLRGSHWYREMALSVGAGTPSRASTYKPGVTDLRSVELDNRASGTQFNRFIFGTEGTNICDTSLNIQDIWQGCCETRVGNQEASHLWHNLYCVSYSRELLDRFLLLRPQNNRYTKKPFRADLHIHTDICKQAPATSQIIGNTSLGSFCVSTILVKWCYHSKGCSSMVSYRPAGVFWKWNDFASKVGQRHDENN